MSYSFPIQFLFISYSFLFISYSCLIHFLFNSYLFPIHSYSFPIPLLIHFLFNSDVVPIQLKFMSHSFLSHFLFIPDHFLFIFVPLSFPKFFKNVIRKWHEVNGKESNSSEWSNPESPIRNPVHTRTTFSNSWSVVKIVFIINWTTLFPTPQLLRGGY